MRQFRRLFTFVVTLTTVLGICSLFLDWYRQLHQHTVQERLQRNVSQNLIKAVKGQPEVGSNRKKENFFDLQHSVGNVSNGEQNITHVTNWRNLSQTELNSLSILGRRMFLGEITGREQNKNFTILFWKTGLDYSNRYLYQYGPKKLDPFAKCSVKNCEVKYDNLTESADAILIHFHNTTGPHSFPNRTRIDQRWIWYTDESPYHTFMLAKTGNMKDYNGYFNWSMSYKMDSDIPVPYGRTVKMTDFEASSYKPQIYFQTKKKLIAVLGSNCGGANKRWDYIRELQKHIDLDTYGGCGKINNCPGSFTRDCRDIDDYKLYLSFENSNCQEYITEKLWWNAIEKGAIPVVMGAPIQDCKKLLPPHSFIHVNDYASPQHLANFLKKVAKNEGLFMSYHAWRAKYKVLNEHGHFATDIFHYCRICEALNYNDEAPKMYNNLESIWHVKTQCYPPIWPKE